MNALTCFLLIVLPMLAGAQPADHPYLLIGSYARAGQTGISVYSFDTKTGDLQYKSSVNDIDNPSYLTAGKNGTCLYAVSEKDKGPGRVRAYRFDKHSASLRFLNETSSAGKGPCYISVDNDGTHVCTANYGSGSIGIIRLDKNGTLDTTAMQYIQHTGNSPHAHSVLVSPDNRYLLSADLGNDHIYIYRYDANAIYPAIDTSYVTVTPGSGPRHICFHPNGKFIFVVNELSGSIDAFDYADGKLSHKQTITMLPDGFTGRVEAADIHASPDGKFLYTSNREERNEIVIYSIGDDGRLTLAGRQSVLGTAPRNFAIDPTGNFLLSANLKSNEVLVFQRDKKTGLLTFTSKRIKVSQPSCLKFLENRP